MARSCHILLLVLLAAGAWAQNQEARATQLLMERLRKAPDGYDPSIRPMTRDGAPTEVKIQTFFRDIEINDVNMEADFDITFRMIWNDNRLTYVQPVEYVTVLETDMLWLPDAFFKNALVTQRETVHPEAFVRIYPTGKVVYSSRLSLKQGCPMNLARFPHDVQTCLVRIGSYGYTTKDLVFKFADADSVSIESDIHADRFTFEKSHSDYCNSVTATGEYTCVEVGMQIRRVFGSYLVDWYIPCMFLVVVAWFSFLVPPEMFLGRLLLTLLPPLALASSSHQNRASLASVPYVRAQDIFTGISLTVMFLTLVYVIVCHVRMCRRNAAKGDEAGGAEDGEANPKPSGKSTLLRRLLQRAEYISRVAIIGAYVFFLFVYFVAYCGTG